MQAGYEANPWVIWSCCCCACIQVQHRYGGTGMSEMMKIMQASLFPKEGWKQQHYIKQQSTMEATSWYWILSVPFFGSADLEPCWVSLFASATRLGGANARRDDFPQFGKVVLLLLYLYSGQHRYGGTGISEMMKIT